MSYDSVRGATGQVSPTCQVPVESSGVRFPVDWHAGLLFRFAE